MRRVAERHLDLSATASGVAVDQADSVRAVLGQPIFRMAHQQQLGQHEEAHRAEIAAVIALLKRAVGVVRARADHRLHIHDRDAAAPAMLQEFGIVYCAVVVDDIRRPLVLAEHDVCRITERRAVEAVRKNLGSAHDGTRRRVSRFQRRVEIDRINPRISPPRGQNQRLFCECNIGGSDTQRKRKQETVDHALHRIPPFAGISDWSLLPALTARPRPPEAKPLPGFFTAPSALRDRLWSRRSFLSTKAMIEPSIAQ